MIDRQGRALAECLREVRDAMDTHTLRKAAGLEVLAQMAMTKALLWFDRSLDFHPEP